MSVERFCTVTFLLLQLNFLVTFDALLEDFALVAEKPIELRAKTPTKAVKIILFADFITSTLFSSNFYYMLELLKMKHINFVLEIAQNLFILKKFGYNNYIFEILQISSKISRLVYHTFILISII